MTPQDLVLTPLGLRFHRHCFPCSIGKGGLTFDKREGDGATPRGVHKITALLFRPDRIAPPAPWAQPIRPGDLWSDAPEDSAYNQHVLPPYPHSHERLRRADPLYDLILLTDWNSAPVRPGRGSAIFLHQWRRPGYPTEGCIAFSRAHLHWIARRAVPGSRLFI